MEYIPERREISTDWLLVLHSNLVYPPLSTYFRNRHYRTLYSFTTSDPAGFCHGTSGDSYIPELYVI